MFLHNRSKTDLGLLEIKKVKNVEIIHTTKWRIMTNQQQFDAFINRNQSEERKY